LQLLLCPQMSQSGGAFNVEVSNANEQENPGCTEDRCRFEDQNNDSLLRLLEYSCVCDAALSKLEEKVQSLPFCFGMIVEIESNANSWNAALRIKSHWPLTRPFVLQVKIKRDNDIYFIDKFNKLAKVNYKKYMTALNWDHKLSKDNFDLAFLLRALASDIEGKFNGNLLDGQYYYENNSKLLNIAVEANDHLSISLIQYWNMINPALNMTVEKEKEKIRNLLQRAAEKSTPETFNRISIIFHSQGQ